jgi:hypothetical protein
MILFVYLFVALIVLGPAVGELRPAHLWLLCVILAVVGLSIALPAIRSKH